MSLGKLNKPERALWRAFSQGKSVDLRGSRDRACTVRAEVIAALLLGAVPAEPGRTPALRLDGAKVAGPLVLDHAQVVVPVRLLHCEFDSVIDLSGARTRDVVLEGSRMAGLVAPSAEIVGGFNIAGCVCKGQIVLTGAHVTGALRMDDCHIDYRAGPAFYASRIVVDDDLFAARATIRGQLRLARARIGGVVILDKANIQSGSDQPAVYAVHLSVGTQLLAREGFTALGEVALNGVAIRANADFRGAILKNSTGDALVVHGAEIGGFLSFGEGCVVHGAIRMSRVKIGGEVYFSAGRFENPGGDAVRCRNAEIGTFALGLDLVIEGMVDLRYSRFTVLRDQQSCGPRHLRVSGLRYETLEPPAPVKQRVAWLRQDEDGYLPQNYETLAGMYRRHGDDAAARTVLLARERERRKQARWYGKPWSLLQEVTVGYGYRPLRAAVWLLAFLVLGTVVFGLHRPPPLAGAPHPAFNPFVYTLDLIVPLVGFGLRGAYDPRGPEQWLSYLLIAVGWIFATTIAAGIARVLQRQ